MGAANARPWKAMFKEDAEKLEQQERAEEALGRKETLEEKSDREEREEEKRRIERENRPLMDDRWENKTTLSMLEAKAEEGRSIKAALRAEYQFLLAQFEARGGKPPPGKRISRKQYLADPEYYRPKWREKYVPNLASSPAGWAFASSSPRAYAEWWDRYSATLPRAPAPQPALYHGVGAVGRYPSCTATPAWTGYNSLPIELRLMALGLPVHEQSEVRPWS